MRAPPQSSLPHSIDAEQQVLGAILLCGDALDAVDNIITAADFFEPIHSFLFAEFAKAKAEGRRISLPLVQALLTEEVKCMDIAGLTVSQYIARMAAEATTVVNAPDHARIVKEHSDRRRLMDLGQGLILAAKAGAEAPRALAADCLEQCDEIVTHYQSLACHAGDRWSRCGTVRYADEAGPHEPGKNNRRNHGDFQTG